MTALWWLRLKATLERTQRLAHSYTEQLLAVYPDRVQALGKGLAMDEERLKVSAKNSASNRGEGTEGWGGEQKGGARAQMGLSACQTCDAGCIASYASIQESLACQLFQEQRPRAGKDPLVLEQPSHEAACCLA